MINFQEWKLGAAGIAVGSAGALIESWMLYHRLAESYPFKVMSVPPAEFYAEAAGTLAGLAPSAAILAGLIFFIMLKSRKIAAGLVPVVLCPVGYIAGLRLLAATGADAGRLDLPVNYDHSSAAMHHQAFFIEAIWLMLFSMIVYLVFTAAVYLVTSRASKKLP